MREDIKDKLFYEFILWIHRKFGGLQIYSTFVNKFEIVPCEAKSGGGGEVVNLMYMVQSHYCSVGAWEYGKGVQTYILMYNLQ